MIARVESLALNLSYCVLPFQAFVQTGVQATRFLKVIVVSLDAYPDSEAYPRFDRVIGMIHADIPSVDEKRRQANETQDNIERQFHDDFEGVLVSFLNFTIASVHFIGGARGSNEQTKTSSISLASYRVDSIEGTDPNDTLLAHMD